MSVDVKTTVPMILLYNARVEVGAIETLGLSIFLLTWRLICQNRVQARQRGRIWAAGCL